MLHKVTCVRPSTAGVGDLLNWHNLRLTFRHIGVTPTSGPHETNVLLLGHTLDQMLDTQIGEKGVFCSLRETVNECCFLILHDFSKIGVYFASRVVPYLLKKK